MCANGSDSFSDPDFFLSGVSLIIENPCLQVAYKLCLLGMGTRGTSRPPDFDISDMFAVRYSVHGSIF